MDRYRVVTKNHFRLACCIGAALLIVTAVSGLQARTASAALNSNQSGTLGKGATFAAVQGGSNQWGVAVLNAGLASVSRQQPVELEFWLGPGRFTNIFSGYRSVSRTTNGFVGNASLTGPNSSKFSVEDEWTGEGAFLRLARTITVRGHATNGFMSGFQFDFDRPRLWTDAEWFAPGMIYGGFDHLTETAIGGKAYYKPGNYTVRIREDRLPAPLFLAHFADNTWLAVMNAAPRGDTTAGDALDVRGDTLMDGKFQFGAIGGQERGGKLSLGYWFPGSEGEVTYAGNTYPGGQLHQWRRRYHPIRDGFVQKYEVQFRLGQQQPFPDSMATAWRWSWQALNPKVTPQDIPMVRRALVDMLAANVLEKDGRAGIPLFINAVTRDMQNADRRAVMGFCGKNLEAANYFFQESALENGARSDLLRQKAEAIAASFVRLKMSPPQGEGFNLDDGVPVCSQRKQQMMFLRSFGDDLKMLLRAYLREKELGHEHPDWLRWCREFADWLLPQQRPDGGFPRAWKFPSVEIGSDSPSSSFNAVPMLVLLNRITGERKYLDAAIRAAGFCWHNGQSRGRFVGGTIDNPDVLDKEAATLSLEAYLALYQATRDAQWLACAKGAANYAETWIYLWNVAMPSDDTNPNRHWKSEASTIGVQLIASGHSLVDQYMSFDADEFARLFQYTGDPHYYEVSRLLLHGTKSMLALPGRTYDLAGPGWQQEHWSLAPRRGYGLHRGWLPWVSTSHLNGIFGLMNLDRGLFEKLCRAEDLK